MQTVEIPQIIIGSFSLYDIVACQRGGLQQTTLAPDSDETRARDPLVC